MLLEYGGINKMRKTETTVALSYTKQRTMFGAVGIEVNPQEQVAYVRLAKQWKRDDMNVIPGQLKELYDKIKWDNTFTDQQIGQHMIRSIQNSLQFQIHTITTQKNLKDPEDIEKIKVMDMTEMVQFTLGMKQMHKIQFPEDHYTKDMEALMKQMEMFQENVTEAGTIGYYAPGDELDSLPKALMICLFGNRHQLSDPEPDIIIKHGTEPQKTVQQSEDEFLEQVLGVDSGSLSSHHLNGMSRDKLFRPRQW